MTKENDLILATYNENSHTFEINDFDQCLANCNDYIKNLLSILPSTITNDEEKKMTKKTRTAINKKLKEIKDGRKSINNIIIGKFNDQTKQVENMLESASNQLKKLLDDYEKDETEKVEEFTISGTSQNKESLEQIKQYAWNNFQVKLNIK